MSLSSSRFLRATPVKNHGRGLTLIFGPDGQVSLIGFNDGIPSQPPGVSPTLTASDTGAPTPGTRSLPTGSTFVSPIPNAEATSPPSTGVSSFTSTSTAFSSSFVSSNYGPSPTVTDPNTFLPTIPTIDYPTPNPTAVSEPKDHGVGAPFYLAIVLASISFVGCIAAFIAWWIRSRVRKHDLEHDDPWHHRDSISNTDSPLTDNINESEKAAYTQVKAQPRPYYLPASIVRRNSSDLFAVPHTIPTSEGGTSQNGFSRPTSDARPLHQTHLSRFQDLSSEPEPHRNRSPPEATSVYPRPGTERLQTGLSVQESTRTLGRLRVANRVPGDVTSGDEGVMNLSRIQSVMGPPAVHCVGPNPAEENAIQGATVAKNDRSVQRGDVPLEPPGPATVSWGRRIDTVAALRRTRRRAPEAAIQMPETSRYGEHWFSTMDGGPSGTTRQAPNVINQEYGVTVERPPLNPLGWTSTLKSSFWQAVDAMTRNRPTDPEPRAANTGSGSRFTPAPQRVASRRPSTFPTHSTAGSALTETHTTGSQDMDINLELTPSGSSVVTQGRPQSTTPADSRGPSAWSNKFRIDKDVFGQVDYLPIRVSHLNRDLGTSTNRQYPIPPRADTGSLYSTDSAAVQANLRKYGYADSIPSSWSALGREPRLDGSRTSLPLRRPTPGSSPGPRSVTPSQLTLEPDLGSGSASVRTRTTVHSGETDIIGSDTGTLRSTGTAVRSVSRDGTTRSWRSAVGAGMGSLPPLPQSSTALSTLSRKKGVTTRRKRTRPPARAPSTASSVQSVESGPSSRDAAVRRALLERRRKVKAVGSVKGHDESATRA